MDTINSNIKFIRKQKRLTQQKFAELIGIKRSSLGAYEEGRAKPGYDTILTISRIYGISIDKLITTDLSNIADQYVFGQGKPIDYVPDEEISGKRIRILPIVVEKDKKKEERTKITVVPEKAHATYLRGYSDPDFIAQMDSINIPFLDTAGGTFRAFQIEGDSMLPVQPKSYIVGEYVDDWNNIKNNQTYIVVSQKDGVVYKRIKNHIKKDQTLELHSDNKVYNPFPVKIKDVLEVWKAKVMISQSLPDAPIGDKGSNEAVTLSDIYSMVKVLQDDVTNLKKKVK